MGLTMRERKKLTVETAKKYFASDKKGKTKILDVFVEQTGYSRKYAIAVLSGTAEKRTVRFGDSERERVCMKRRSARKKRVYRAEYGDDVTEMLEKIWSAFDYKCSQLLVPFIRANLDYLASQKEFRMSDSVREKLGRISSATADRRLRKIRARTRVRGLSTTRAASNLNSLIPIRTYFRWDERKPGFFEADTVAHCGTRNAGEYLLTLTATDVGSGWTELRAMLNKAQRWVRESLGDIKAGLPFPMLGLDTDNGDEFKNRTVLQWCAENSVSFTRSRPYRKNDNCFVEEKNFTEVRCLVGYSRYEGEDARTLMSELYKKWCLLINYFYPCLRLKEKIRSGAKVTKRYDRAKTPYERLLESPDVDEQAKQRLKEARDSLDLLQLKKDVVRLRDALLELAVKQT